MYQKYNNCDEWHRVGPKTCPGSQVPNGVAEQRSPTLCLLNSKINNNNKNTNITATSSSQLASRESNMENKDRATQKTHACRKQDDRDHECTMSFNYGNMLWLWFWHTFVRWGPLLPLTASDCHYSFLYFSSLEDWCNRGIWKNTFRHVWENMTSFSCC